MENPVMSMHGISYEKHAITKWFDSGKRYCPVTGDPISMETLSPNSSLQWKIRYWQMKNDQEDTEHSLDDEEDRIKMLPQARFLCPLTGKVMIDPVMTREGKTICLVSFRFGFGWVWLGLCVSQYSVGKNVATSYFSFVSSLFSILPLT
jgi:U-box domain